MFGSDGCMLLVVLVVLLHVADEPVAGAGAGQQGKVRHEGLLGNFT